MSIGEKLRGLRNEKTLHEVSMELGISKSALAMYERDQRIPRDEVKVKLSSYYQVPINELFFEAIEH